MLEFDSKNLDCNGCPALTRGLLNVRQIDQYENRRWNYIKEVENINIILLCESVQRETFIYDPVSDNSNNSLNFRLCRELIGEGSKDQLMDYLKRTGTVVLDCALCPLSRLWYHAASRNQATQICLSRHNKETIDAFPNAEIISIFPSVLKKTNVISVDKRIRKGFAITNLSGLRDEIEIILRERNM